MAVQQPTQHLDQLAGKWVLLYTTITITVRHRIQLALQGDGWALSYASDLRLHQLAGKWVLLYTTITITVRRHQQQTAIVTHS
jgi:predicted house-cleaning NTP pyrophosphatase (Maf/HAM1 superfamily)